MPHLPWASTVQRLVGERIRQLRSRRSPAQLTQQKLAERTRGVLSRSSIANIERGRQGISLEQLFVLAEALEVEPVELLPSRQDVFGSKADILTTLRKPIRKDDREWMERVRQVPSNKSGGDDA